MKTQAIRNMKQNFIWILASLMFIRLLSLPSMSLAREGKWRKRTDMPTPRFALSTAVVNGKIYAIGGTADGKNLVSIPTVEVYDPVLNTWTKKADMTTRRSLFGAAVVNEKIYVIGGWTDLHNMFIASVEEYDPPTDTWTKKANLPTPRSGLSTAVVKDKIYAIGGDGVSTVEVYDPLTDSLRCLTFRPIRFASISYRRSMIA